MTGCTTTTVRRLVLAAALLSASLAPAATFTVTKTADDNGACDADCALREAILAANGAPGADLVVVPAGTYPLVSGSLLATGDLEIIGDGADTTIIDGQGVATVLEVSGLVAIADLAIRNGTPANNGGAIDNAGSLTLTAVVLRDNLSPAGPLTIGGAVYNHGTLAVYDSTITNNSATFGGGGILNEVGATLTLVNTTISGNINDGLFDAGFSTIISSTIVGNSGDGVSRFGSSATRRTHLANSVVADNELNCTGSAGGIISDGYNADGGSSCPFTGTGDASNVDAQLAPLGDYGGGTPTHALCSGAGVPDASCSAASPLIGAANPAAPGSGGGACPAADQRGVARDQTPCDIGAYEVACADAILDATETCDDGNLTDDDGCDSNCTQTACGNGIVTAGEACDDGNDDDTDGCTNACTSCGDGLTSAPEECDDANLISDDGCDANCTVTACGNGVTTGGEDCDDGNLTAGDCCSATCGFESAGSPCGEDGFACTADQCDGAAACVHALLGAGTVCRTAAGICDAVESCDGGAPECPPDQFLSAATTCRPSGGICDPLERCTGVDLTCPPDAKSTAECSPGAGPCDPAEICDGVSDTCPAPQFAPDGTTCDDGDPDTNDDACAAGVCVGLPQPIDPFKCYIARDLKTPPFDHATLALTDDMESASAVATKPRTLCNPVSLDGSAVANPTQLTCYAIKRAPGAAPFAPRAIEATDAFGSVQLELRKPSMLCVPSATTVLP